MTAGWLRWGRLSLSALMSSELIASSCLPKSGRRAIGRRFYHGEEMTKSVFFITDNEGGNDASSIGRLRNL